MTTVTALHVNPRRPDRVEVRFDGAPTLVLSAERAADLELGQDLDAVALQALQAEAERGRALDRALRFIAVRPRSTAEVASRLARAGFDRPTAAHVLERLRGAQLLDDEVFARWWVADRSDRRPRSRRALAAELAARGVDRTAIDAALAGLEDDQAVARRLARERAPRFARLDRDDFDRRLGSWLTRRGFSMSAIRSALDEAWRSLPDD